MSYRIARPGSTANLDPEGTTGWTERAGRWIRENLGHALEVWRDPATGWRWSMDGQTAPRVYSSRDKAMKLARQGAQRGRVPCR